MIEYRSPVRKRFTHLGCEVIETLTAHRDSPGAPLRFEHAITLSCPVSYLRADSRLEFIPDLTARRISE